MWGAATKPPVLISALVSPSSPRIFRVSSRERSCRQAAGFVPIAGHRYDIVQRTDYAGCRLEIIDSATGAPPPTLQPLDAKTACADYLRQGDETT